MNNFQWETCCNHWETIFRSLQKSDSLHTECNNLQESWISSIIEHFLQAGNPSSAGVLWLVKPPTSGVCITCIPSHLAVSQGHNLERVNFPFTAWPIFSVSKATRSLPPLVCLLKLWPSAPSCYKGDTRLQSQNMPAGCAARQCASARRGQSKSPWSSAAICHSVTHRGRNPEPEHASGIQVDEWPMFPQLPVEFIMCLLLIMLWERKEPLLWYPTVAQPFCEWVLVIE